MRDSFRMQLMGFKIAKKRAEEMSNKLKRKSIFQG